MSESTITAGTWLYGQMGNSDGNEPVHYVRSTSITALQLMTEGPDVCLCMREDHARLIAAAPDLLEALRAAVAGYKGMSLRNCPFWITDARAAIAKAEDRS